MVSSWTVIYFVAAGNTIRIYGHDISEYKQARTSTGNRNYLNNLLDYANAPIIVWDTITASPVLICIWKVNRLQISAGTWVGLDILFRTSKNWIASSNKRTLSAKGGKLSKFHSADRRANPHCVMEFSNVTIRRQADYCHNRSGQDITERIIAEEKVNNLNEILNAVHLKPKLPTKNWRHFPIPYLMTSGAVKEHGRFSQLYWRLLRY